MRCRPPRKKAFEDSSTLCLSVCLSVCLWVRGLFVYRSFEISPVWDAFILRSRGPATKLLFFALCARNPLDGRVLKTKLTKEFFGQSIEHENDAALFSSKVDSKKMRQWRSTINLDLDRFCLGRGLEFQAGGVQIGSLLQLQTSLDRCSAVSQRKKQIAAKNAYVSISSVTYCRMPQMERGPNFRKSSAEFADRPRKDRDRGSTKQRLTQ